MQVWAFKEFTRLLCLLGAEPLGGTLRALLRQRGCPVHFLMCILPRSPVQLLAWNHQLFTLPGKPL